MDGTGREYTFYFGIKGCKRLIFRGKLLVSGKVKILKKETNKVPSKHGNEKWIKMGPLKM